MKIACRVLVFVSALMFMFGVDFVVETSPQVSFVKEAQAIVGAPRTPVSAAGVARRTTRRVVATERSPLERQWQQRQPRLPRHHHLPRWSW